MTYASTCVQAFLCKRLCASISVSHGLALHSPALLVHRHPRLMFVVVVVDAADAAAVVVVVLGVVAVCV